MAAKRAAWETDRIRLKTGRGFYQKVRDCRMSDSRFKCAVGDRKTIAAVDEKGAAEEMKNRTNRTEKAGDTERDPCQK
jgi:putative ribosome biogenesis GTPase RsgA